MLIKEALSDSKSHYNLSDHIHNTVHAQNPNKVTSTNQHQSAHSPQNQKTKHRDNWVGK